MRTIVRYVLAFLAALLVTSILASIFSTQFVISGLQSVGVDIPFGVRASMTVADMAILRVLLITVTACSLVGFLVAGLCASKLPGSRTIWFVIGGGIALITELLLLSSAFGGMPIAGARTTSGLIFQGIAGAAGGWCFAWITARRGRQAESGR
jgi:hypothetical protein